MVQNENNLPSQEPKIYQTENTQELIKKVNERKIIKEEKLNIQGIMAQIIKKVLDHKINLTLEQILVMSPKFFNQLKNLSEEEKKSINSIDTKEIQTKLINHHLGNYEHSKLHYACPLGFMQVYLGEEGNEIMSLVDTGLKLNIISEYSEIKEGLTTRFLNMNLRGIGGHCTSIVGLAEFTPITLVTGEERNINLFVARGAVHTVLGRPFLADNNIRSDFYQQKGEIFSYIDPDGRRLCLPICSPQKVGWREEPPAGMETCAVSQLEYWKELPKENESSPKNQENFEENSHQVLDSEEVKDSKDKVKIHEELAPINTEDFNLKLKKENSPGILASRKENGNTCSQISQSIKIYNFKNPEDIKRKTLTKLFSSIKDLKSLSKGIFKNNWKSSIKTAVTIVSVSSESKFLSSQIDKSALK
ncbi:hypothetical protein O181_099446 [Austropuccinia psidii MF-1]|uniref:Peptidase A2 domain-containing protein n=1 Tax=Austropuccinia psidii MF-1 TaxID=1389203 RepID=A0A9Q3PGU5_9BASI|nr:hypothetical protein [Austropuccinia psidii MF-1]